MTIATLTRNALEVIHQRPYIQPGETPDDMFRRVAQHVASVEADPDFWGTKFYELMSSLSFLPNTPTLAHAGVPGSTHCFSACFVDSPEDSLESISRVGADMALIESSGGGIGFGLSRLRPYNDKIGSSPSGACGPLRVLHWYSAGGNTFTQGAIRQGAHMAQLHCSHPDVLEFIRCKNSCLLPTDPLSNFNISVQLTDDFMHRLRDGESWDLINPRTGLVTSTIQAQDLWDAICASAWTTGDPGVVFMDRVDEAAPNPSLGKIESSNPCGEEFLEDGASCNLGSINLSKYTDIRAPSFFDYLGFRRDIGTAIRFLDDVIDVNNFPLTRLSEINQQTRRVGLGVMGWADALVHMGFLYDSGEAINLAEELSGILTEEAVSASEALAEEKGAFPLFSESVFSTPRRNSNLTTIAPTGSISIIAGCSSGIEPHYSLAWERQSIWDVDGTHKSVLFECPAPLRTMIESNLGFEEEVDEVLEETIMGDPSDVAPDLKNRVGWWNMELFRTAHEISPDDHVRMQAAWQSGVTNGVSKTVNLPSRATPEDISQAFRLAWGLGCKAVTVYRDGSKSQQILGSGSKSKTPQDHTSPGARPKILRGETVSATTGHGAWFFTINQVDGPNSPPIEVFLVPSEHNSCVRAGAEITGRLISTALRSGVDVQAIVNQLRGVDCGHPVWSDGELVTSVYDALARTLGRFGSEVPPLLPSSPTSMPPDLPELPGLLSAVGELCAKCGQPAAVERGGCLTCLACGNTSCE